ncbi:hypothetical protein, partial [Planococcus sp. CAU13]|uniref:hypothetical protein n=1 Tax=Planococcus sp. CAU13 TaxID=1541197 RepID=UPI001F2C1819
RFSPAKSIHLSFDLSFFVGLELRPAEFSSLEAIKSAIPLVDSVKAPIVALREIILRSQDYFCVQKIISA